MSTSPLPTGEMPAILDRFRLDGRVAVVTGASSGIGAACALALVQAGAAAVVLGARRGGRLAETVESVRRLGGQAEARPTDVTDPDQCERLAGQALSSFGRIDVLVNAAGMSGAVPALREEPAHFRQVVDVNLMGSYWMAQACARVMPAGSSIVNVSSTMATTTTAAPQAAYTASKAAVEGLTRDLAQQWTGRRGIRVNAVAPGFVPTELTADAHEYVDRVVAQRVLCGRWADVEEVATAVVFLAGPAASYVTGAVLVVDGGMRIT